MKLRQAAGAGRWTDAGLAFWYNILDLQKGIQTPEEGL